jgi:integrase-like protein
VAETLTISRSSLYYRKRANCSRADRTDDERIVAAQAGHGRQRQARVAGDARARPAGPAGTLSRLAQEGLKPRGGAAAEPGLAVGHDQGLGRAFDGLVVPGLDHRLLNPRDRGLGSEPALPHRRGSCRAGTDRTRPPTPRPARPWTYPDHRQRHAVHFGALYRNPQPARHPASPPRLQSSEGNSYIERFHRSLKEAEVWINEYQSFDHAKQSIAQWIEEYNHDRPHCGLRGRTPHEASAQFQAKTLTSNSASNA